MPSETFYCPHCKRRLTKSSEAYVLEEIMTNEKSYFIGLGELPSNITCPGCGGRIDSMKMIKGEYDHGKQINWQASWIYAIVIIGVLVILFLVSTKNSGLRRF